MSDLIAIILSILIGLGIKWVEGRHKDKKNSAPAVGRNKSYSDAYSPRYQRQVAEPAVQPPQVSKPKAVEYKPMFEEGQCSVSHEEPEVMQAAEGPSEAELAAHYDRWRQAIIDAQIITPKFKEI